MTQQLKVKWKQNAQDFADILEFLSTSKGETIQSDSLQEIREYLDFNEFGLAFEMLLDYLCALPLGIPASVFVLVERLGTRMQYEPAVWQELRRRVDWPWDNGAVEDG